MALPEVCPLCQSDRALQSVVTPHVFGDSKNTRRSFFHCEECDVRYLYPALTEDEEHHFYAEEFESFMANRSGKVGGWQLPEEHVCANEVMRKRRMGYIQPLLGDCDRLLEVGCSSGFMLYPLIDSGYRCVGVEPSGVFGEYLKHRGVETFESMADLESSVTAQKFNLIMHFFVLEHIGDPLAFLNSQLSLLEEGGKILFEIPNVADPLYSVFEIPDFERFYWSIAHPWYFSENALNYLLTKLGYPYEIIRDQRYDLSNHMIWARDGVPGGMGRFDAIFDESLEVAYRKSLIESGKCDTLIGIISKV